jgi:hypothetical protein
LGKSKRANGRREDHSLAKGEGRQNHGSRPGNTMRIGKGKIEKTKWKERSKCRMQN